MEYICLKLFLVCVLVSGVYSVSVVNNVTLSGSILNDVFFNEISTNLNLHGSYNNSQKCIKHLREIIHLFPNMKVVPFFDSWGKFPSGILYGNVYDVGNFDQCVKTSVALSENNDDVINGQFCFAKVPLKNLQPHHERIPLLIDQALLPEARAGLSNMELNIGICIPDSCSSELITSIFEKAIKNRKFHEALSGTSVHWCTDGKQPPYKPVNVIGIAIFALFGVLMLTSSLYEMFMTIFEKKPIPVLLAFSILTNGKKLFAFNTKSSPNTIECLTGIRVISMAWVMSSHTYMTLQMIPAINTIDNLAWFKKLYSMYIINGTVSVDSFFFISGLLVAWLGFREMDKNKGKLDIVMMYVHRYIRLTPVVAAGILYTFSVNELIFNGPFREKTLATDNCTRYNWWPILLYIQNYFIQEPQCFARTWYLAVDFQLYILSPLLLVPMWKWGKKFAPVLLLLVLMSIACIMTIFITNGFTSLKPFVNENEWFKVTIPMHTRCSPWLVGFALGYFMHVNRNRSFHLSKITALLGWVSCIAVMAAIVFGPYFTISTRVNGTVLEAAFYEGWKRFSWGIALAWVAFACHFGYGGLVDSFLSHPLWQPFAKLTYSLYLIHSFVLRVNFGMMRTELYFSDYNAILYFWSTFGISLMFAIASTLAFESPILILEKFIFGKQNSISKTPAENVDNDVTLASKIQKWP